MASGEQKKAHVGENERVCVCVWMCKCVSVGGCLSVLVLRLCACVCVHEYVCTNEFSRERKSQNKTLNK